MSHDLEASWAASEVALLGKHSPASFFRVAPSSSDLSCYAVREGRSAWPIPDGVVSVEHVRAGRFEVALEYKRPNEGLHGTLTALGQAHAYLEKGFAGAIIVIPKAYETHSAPGTHINRIITKNSDNLSIGIATYDTPNPSTPRPFQDRLTFIRPINLGDAPPPPVAGSQRASTTQWLHIRAGEWSPSMILSYLRAANQLATVADVEYTAVLPQELVDAVDSLAPGLDPFLYLSGSASSSSSFHDRVWRHFWFGSVLHAGNWRIWSSKTASGYQENLEPTKILQQDGTPSRLFCGRTNSIRAKLIASLNAGSITEQEAWRQYAEYFGFKPSQPTTNRGRAHSYRENIDSYISGLGFIDAEGRPTELGNRFLYECMRTGDPNTGIPKMIFSAALLRNGNFGALAHFIFRLSEKHFDGDPLAFTRRRAGRRLDFLYKEYTEWVWERLANELRVMKLGRERAGGTRGKLLDEIAVMRYCGFAGDGYRVAVGLPLNWARIQQVLDFPLE